MSSVISYTHCPVCGSSAIHYALKAVDHTVSGEFFDILQCAGCSVRFTQDIPDVSGIGRYYRSEAYISHTNTRKGIVNNLYHFARKFTRTSKKRLIGQTTGLSKGDLLDIGAGTGAFVHYMRGAGWNAAGLEQDTEAIKNAAALFDIELKPSASLFELPPEHFDVITLWHVLEHVHPLHEYMEQLKRLCRPDGRIFIAVPNYTSYDANKYDGSWAAYDVPRHLYHFSPASMEVLTKMHGLTIKGIRPMWLDSFYVSLLSEKYKHGKGNILRGLWNGLVSDNHTLYNTRRASSLIYIVSRQF
ncbi:MAG TPA: class I SAM-dependent methyltransferase [Flavitalea sp.]|nr:class I SAM-dependent methyltransferase [Flavitalea sp.]